MINGKKILAVITARAGSKRLAHKNTMDLAGLPLISWTFNAAKKSRYIDKLIVSTDSQEIAELAKQNEVEVPFIRPEELSGDTATSIEVLNHSIESVAERYEYIVLLQPTSPLRSTSDVDTAIEMLNDGIQAIVSVCEAEHSPKWMNTLPEDHSMKNFLADQSKNKRSQDLGSYYRLNGAIYVAEIDYFNDNKGFFGDATKAYIMPRARSIDIDSQEDLDYAAFLISKKRKA